MKQLTINAYSRETAGTSSSKRLRREGKIPAVVYGKTKEPVNLYIDASDFRIALKELGNNSPVVQLKSEGGDSKTSIIKGVQRHSVTDKYLHIDFHEVAEGELIKVAVPVHPTGEAFGVKTEGGTLEYVLQAVHVRCSSKDIPEFVEADVSELKVGDSFHVKSLPAIDGVTYLDHPEQPVYSVAK
ncbi:50S ribosomal protein L25 [Puniceicoccaceae bacterium K14]|nr:50S ribosomal protein L25 [Puniceicoccaceae bacterium K14]